MTSRKQRFAFHEKRRTQLGQSIIKFRTKVFIGYFSSYCEANNVSRDQMADYLIAERKTWRMLHPGRLSRSYASLAMKGQAAWFPKNVFTV